MSTVTALKGTYPKNLPLTQVVCPRKGRAFPQKITEKTTANNNKKKKGEKKKKQQATKETMWQQITMGYYLQKPKQLIHVPHSTQKKIF